MVVVGGIIAYLLIAAAFAYITARLTGDGLGPIAIIWPVVIVLIIPAAVFAFLGWLTNVGNHQHEGRK